MKPEWKIHRRFLTAGDIQLCCVDFGGNGEDGPPALLLHGLAGRGNEWRSTASWLTQHCHVFALDQRGHGMSDKTSFDYTYDAYVHDAIDVIEQVSSAPVILIGQSMGGKTAFLTAARRPDLVRGLIVVEAKVSEDPEAQKLVRDWFARWPVPFPTLADAKSFFGGNTLTGETWIEFLEERPDGYWPLCDSERLLAGLTQSSANDYWPEWEQITCPTLLVGGERSIFSQGEMQEMARRIPRGRYIVIPDAGHDLHLEQPEAWRRVAEEFLSELELDGR